MQRKFLRLPDVRARFGIGDTTVYKGVGDGTLPPPIKLTKRTSVWVEDELDAVIGARIEEDRARDQAARGTTGRSAHPAERGRLRPWLERAPRPEVVTPARLINKGTARSSGESRRASSAAL